ncbi:MAG: phosphotransferase family protein [Candidatus Binatia bacterium]|nr:phosphotransferase family protein [Candidatus Binatia bacterium]
MGCAELTPKLLLEEQQRLQAWLDQQGLPGQGLPLDVEFISGGASNEAWLLRRGEFQFVVRKPPRLIPEGRNESMVREFRVLSALRDSDVPHPRVLALCTDPQVLGSNFYVMEYVRGWSCMNQAQWPSPFDTDLEARRGLAWELIDGIAKLSRVDWQAVGLEGFGRPLGFHERQVDRWLGLLAKFQFRPLPGLQEAADWLRHYRPRHYVPGILHGDYQFANVMFAHGAPARLAAIVDWEMATVGDPLLDLGWVLMAWPDPDEDREHAGYVDYTGMPTRAELAERYARVSGRPVDELDYYVILARFKMAVVLEQGYAAWVQGRAGNPKMAFFGEVVLTMARKAAELANTTPLGRKRWI